jgi:hypothetical protein
MDSTPDGAAPWPDRGAAAASVRRSRGRRPAAHRSAASRAGALLGFGGALAGGVLLGLACGLAWAAAAPRAVFTVTGPGQASLVHVETGAFIGADAWYAGVAVAGGAILGLAGYQLAVRRFGPVPMAGIGLGAVAGAFAARWSGQQAGLAAFNSRLAASRPGTLLSAPVVLGARSAMAFWPLAACLVAGALQARAMLAARARAAGRQRLVPGQALWQGGPFGSGEDGYSQPRPPGQPGRADSPGPGLMPGPGGVPPGASRSPWSPGD